MYAVIETGGKQYRVEVGTELEVELLDANQGDSVTLDRVLLVADGDTASIGRPLVSNAKVAAEFSQQFPALELVTIDKDFNGWKETQPKFFNDGGVFDQIYGPGN